MAEIKHFGILGMRWGHRKARNAGGSSGGGTARRVLNKTTDVLMGKAGKELLRKDIARAKSVGDKILNNPVFKAMIYNKDNGGFIRKDAVGADIAKAKAATEKGKSIVDKILNNSAFKAMVYDKDNGGFIRKDAVKKDLGGLKTKLSAAKQKFEANQIKSQRAEIAKLKSLGKDKEAKELQDDMDSLWTKEEQKKLAG